MQEILRPDVFWYNAGLPENLPGINFGGPDGKVLNKVRVGTLTLSIRPSNRACPGTCPASTLAALTARC